MLLTDWFLIDVILFYSGRGKNLSSSETKVDHRPLQIERKNKNRKVQHQSNKVPSNKSDTEIEPDHIDIDINTPNVTRNSLRKRKQSARVVESDDEYEPSGITAVAVIPITTLMTILS